MEEKTRQELMQELAKLKKAQARIKRKFTFLLSIIAMLVLITATLAWFTLSNFASIHEINLKISTAPELYLDVDNHGADVSLYKKILTNDMVNSYLSSVNAPRIDQQLLDPVTTSNGIAFQSQSGATRNPNEDESFIEFKVWFIATKEMWVHLSGQTVQIQGEESSSRVTTTETGAKADIVNACRISFEDNGTAAIWEPNKGAAVNGQSTFDVSNTFSNDTRIFHLDKLTPKQITIRIWAEGNDPECDNDVQEANVTFEMLFGGTDENNMGYE